jgi:hypothetical protein
LSLAESEASEAMLRDAARRLNPDHFRILAGATPFRAVLEQVWRSPGELFPFSYR